MHSKPPFWTPSRNPPSVWPRPWPRAVDEKGTVQPALTKVIQQYKRQATPLRLLDTHRITALPPGRKPDIIVVPAAQMPADVSPASGQPVPSAYYIVSLGDVKEYRPAGEFTDAELGELEGFLQCLMEWQSHRTFAVGFLINCVHVQFMVIRRAVNPEFELELSPRYAMTTSDGKPDEGARYLHGLLQCTVTELGASLSSVTVKSQPIIIGQHLGIGSVSSVWAGKAGTEDVVVKFYRHGEEARLATEEANLQQLRDRLPAEDQALVPQLKGIDCQANALVLTPRGRPFARSIRELAAGKRPVAVEHLCQLIDVLSKVHKCAGLVHRDIAPRNFFLLPQQGQEQVRRCFTAQHPLS